MVFEFKLSDEVSEKNSYGNKMVTKMIECIEKKYKEFLKENQLAEI